MSDVCTHSIESALARTIHCVRCDSELEAVDTDSHQPYRGVLFQAFGNYGSSVYDPYNESHRLVLALCDECVVKSAATGAVLMYDVTTPRPEVTARTVADTVAYFADTAVANKGTDE